MKRSLHYHLLAATLIIFTGSANAALIRNTDYVSDTATGFNWVLGNSSNIAATLGQGGAYEGWRVATETDIVTLFNAAGGSGTYNSANFFDTNDWSTADNGFTATLASYFGYTRGGGGNTYTFNWYRRQEVVGLIDAGSGGSQNYAAGAIDWASPAYRNGDYVFSSALSRNSSRYWLLQGNNVASVPEPASIALFAMGLLMISSTRLRHQHRYAGKRNRTTLA